jgi:hypothetical protein
MCREEIVAFVKNLHRGSLLAPVMRLAARIVAVLPILPALSAFRIRAGERNYLATIPAERNVVTTGGHQPVHLQVHSS